MFAILSPICASAICYMSLTFPTKLVPIVCVLTATYSLSCLPVNTPFLTGRLLSSFTVLFSACSSIAFFTSSWARSRKESASYIECMPSTSSNSRWLTCVFACQLSCFPGPTCRLEYICKEVLHYFPDLLYVVCTYSP